VGTVERAWRWCQRNPRIAGLSATVSLLLLFSTVGSVLSALWIAAEQRETKKQQVAAEQAGRAAQKNAADAELAQQQAESLALSARQQRNLALAAHVNLVRGVQDRLADTPGTLALRKELLESAVAGLEKIVREASTPDDRDRTLFLAHQRLGEVYFVVGRTADSRREIEQAHSLAKQLYDRQPNDPVAQLDLVVAATSLGEFNIKTLDYKASQTPLQEALRLLDQLPSQLPDGIATNTHRIRVLSNLGDAALRLNDIAAAEAQFQQASNLAEELRASQGLDAQSRRIADSVLRRLGDAALIRGEMGRGVDFYRHSVRSAEDAGLASFSLLERQGLIDAYGRLGLVLVWLGEAEEAERCFRKGIDLVGEALRTEPENIGLARKLAVFYQRLGDVSWTRGDYATMRQHLLTALERHRELRGRDAKSLQTQNDLVVCLEQFARLEGRLEKYREAEGWYGEALSILRSRKDAGTLTDPVSIGFEKTFTLIQEIFIHLPAVLDAQHLPDNVTPIVAAALGAERAVVFARRGSLALCDAELVALGNRLEQLSPADRAPIQLAVARAAAIAAQHAAREGSVANPIAESALNRPQHFQDLALTAIEKFIAADPFNATQLRFEYELRPLDGLPRFERLVARFRDPQAPANSKDK
jgi:tetratricopeptide (TPR) repeat protein